MDHKSIHNDEYKVDSSEHSHEGHMGHMGNLKQKFFISLIFAIPILLMSPMMGIDLPFQLTFMGSNWIVLILSTILFFYGGMPFLNGAREELKDKSPAMMTLISLGITTSYVYSIYAFIVNNFFTVGDHVMDFFWELASLIVIMLLGHWIEMKAVSGAGDALKEIAKLLPSEASLQMENGKFENIPLDKLKIGQVVMVKPGEKIPADGHILEGNTSVNESMVTGESREVLKKLGDKVIGGSQNGSGSIIVEVTGTGESGYLAQVMELVTNAQKEKSKSETMSDKVARWLFFIATGIGILSFVIWYFVTRDISLSITRMVTVFVIACPHALGLAIPLVVARSTSIGAKNGLLVRKRQSLEKALNIDTIMMDKTGTLTEGNFKVVAVESLNTEYSDEETLSMMVALEYGSSHPLAIGIIEEGNRRNIPHIKANNIENLPGVGLKGKIDNKEAMMVTESFLKKNNISYDEKKYFDLSDKGYSVSFLVLDREVVGIVAQGDEIKPDSDRLISGLKKRGIVPIMLTGDNKNAAEKIASVLEIEDYYSQLLPENKESIVKEYQTKGKVVAMVGDGVNDAPSLARADIGIAIGAGTDVAIDSADVVLVRSNPSDILSFLSLAENTTRKMVQNLWWGAGYNIIAIPLAAGILAPLGIILSPAVGAVLMSLSTVIVSINSMTLRIK